MNLPGFMAELSLQKTKTPHYLTFEQHTLSNEVIPSQATRFSRCLPRFFPVCTSHPKEFPHLCNAWSYAFRWECK